MTDNRHQPSDPTDCGTLPGAQRHRRTKTPFCDPCRKAANAHTTELRHARAERRRAEDAAKLALLLPLPARRRVTT